MFLISLISGILEILSCKFILTMHYTFWFVSYLTGINLIYFDLHSDCCDLVCVRYGTGIFDNTINSDGKVREYVSIIRPIQMSL